MRFKLVLGILGYLIFLFSLSFLIPIFSGFLLRESSYELFWMFAAPMLFFGFSGLLLSRIFQSDETLRDRESFLLVGITWFLIALIGASPYYAAHEMELTGENNLTPIRSIFESFSGFTTTGATLLEFSDANGDGYFDLPKSLLLWRSLSQWFGGMGIIVLATVVLSRLIGGGVQILRAEMPGTDIGKIKPRMVETAKLLWLIYVFLSLLETFLLKFIAGLSFYDSICITLSTISTGGFCPRIDSIAYYNSALVESIITSFMLISGINFVLLYFFFSNLIKNNLSIFEKLRSSVEILRSNGEFRFYIFFIVTGTFLVFLGRWAPLVDGLNTPHLENIRTTIFQTISLLTGTGFTTDVYTNWPSSSVFVLLFVMFIGGCAGSTTGGMKIVRIELLLKALKRELFMVIHPRAVVKLRIGGKSLDENLVHNIAVFFFIYISLFLLGALALLYFQQDWTLIDGIGASLACISNVGPGVGAVGPDFNYSGLESPSLILCSLLMWLGRLEIITGLLLFFPGSYKE